jgi:hypothetical protein
MDALQLFILRMRDVPNVIRHVPVVHDVIHSFLLCIPLVENILVPKKFLKNISFVLFKKLSSASLRLTIIALT